MPKSNKNNPDPVPFIRIKKEKIINEAVRSETLLDIEEIECKIQSDFNLMETNDSRQNIFNRGELFPALLVKKDEIAIEFECSTAENPSRICMLEKEIKKKNELLVERLNEISKLKTKNKKKSKLLNEKAGKIAILKKKLSNLKEKLKNSSQPLQSPHDKKGKRASVYRKKKKKFKLIA